MQEPLCQRLRHVVRVLVPVLLGLFQRVMLILRAVARHQCIGIDDVPGRRDEDACRYSGAAAEQASMLQPQTSCNEANPRQCSSRVTPRRCKHRRNGARACTLRVHSGRVTNRTKSPEH